MIGEAAVRRASEWCYQGIWGTLTRYFAVPEHPPVVTGGDDQSQRSFRPSNGYLRYLKFQFWIALFIVDAALITGWIITLFAAPVVGIVTTPIWWFVIVVPDIFAYIAIHLRFDTTWYVLSDRSMCIRRGIWTIHDTTITYENIQNVSVRQGPLQRYFGIATVFVQTAGGGSGAAGAQGAQAIGHHGLLEGIDNAEEVRNLIIERWTSAKSAGLGDDRHISLQMERSTEVRPGQSLDNYQTTLEEIRDLAVQLARTV